MCHLSLLFPLGSLKTPINGSKLFLKLPLLFSKLQKFGLLIPSQSSKQNYFLITVCANFTFTYPAFRLSKSQLFCKSKIFCTKVLSNQNRAKHPKKLEKKAKNFAFLRSKTQISEKFCATVETLLSFLGLSGEFNV